MNEGYFVTNELKNLKNSAIQMSLAVSKELCQPELGVTESGFSKDNFSKDYGYRMFIGWFI
jgi:hypothetical protein